jgi:hypothetical protein
MGKSSNLVIEVVAQGLISPIAGLIYGSLGT